MTKLYVYRIALDTLCARYFTEEDSRSKKQRPFASLEVLYVREKDTEAGIVEELIKFVESYGHVLTCLNLEDAYEGSGLSIDASDSSKP
jgi:hypothetical protein